MEHEQKKTNPVAILIAILLFLLVIEAGILIHKLSNTNPSHTEKNPAASVSEPDAGTGTSTPSQTPAALLAAFSQPQPGLGQPYHRSPIRRPANFFTPTTEPQAFDDAFKALERIQERMNQMFDTAFLYGPPAANHFMNTVSGGPDSAFVFEPAVDIKDDGKNYVVTTDLPGLDKNKINITVTGTQLTIEGARENVTEKKDDKTGFVTQERTYGNFSRSLTLPGPVDDSKISADYKNGVLTVTLPKTAQKGAQKVAVQ